MPVLTDLDRYQRYMSWCLILGVEPASFDAWRLQNRKIYDRLPIAWCAQGGHRKQFA